MASLGSKYFVYVIAVFVRWIMYMSSGSSSCPAGLPYPTRKRSFSNHRTKVACNPVSSSGGGASWPLTAPSGLYWTSRPSGAPTRICLPLADQQAQVDGPAKGGDSRPSSALVRMIPSSETRAIYCESWSAGGAGFGRTSSRCEGIFSLNV